MRTCGGTIQVSLRKKVGLIGHALALGWVYPIGAALSGVLRVPTHHKLTHVWARWLQRRFRVKLTELEGEVVLTSRRCLYFAPHRSFADLFLHKLITDGQGATLSRAGMGMTFPLTWLTTRLDRSTWFFRRNRRRGIKAFYSWLDREFERCPLNGLIVYPEGHRHTSEKPLRLMPGMVNYAYSRGLPVQIISTERTERVLNEKEWDYSYGVEVKYRVEAPIDPRDYPTRKAFQDEITAVFTRAYTEVTAPISCYV